MMDFYFESAADCCSCHISGSAGQDLLTVIQFIIITECESILCKKSFSHDDNSNHKPTSCSLGKINIYEIRDHQSRKPTFYRLKKNHAGAAGQGSTQTPVANVPVNGYKDGTYEGSGTGFGGTIRVRVTVSGGRITAIDILDASGETPSYFAAAQGVISKMIEITTPEDLAVAEAFLKLF